MKEENFTSDGDTGRCVICLRDIERAVESRTIRLANSEFLAHGFCLLRLRRLACEMYDASAPIPTINRALTLNEFLLMKRPQTNVEILCCLAYYQKDTPSAMMLSESLVQEQLQYSPFKIADILLTLREATDTLGYFRRLSKKGDEWFQLTKKGEEIVKRLPPIPE